MRFTWHAPRKEETQRRVGTHRALFGPTSAWKNEQRSLMDTSITIWLRRCSRSFALSGCNVRIVVENKNQLIRIMENSANQQSQHNDRAPGDTVSAQDKPKPESSVLGAIGAGIRRGAEDAKAAAQKVAPKVQSAAADTVYWAAYGVSFAAVFQWTLAKGLAPESLKSGCRDGVKAGREAAEKWIARLKQRKEKAPAATSDQTSPSTAAGAA